MRWGLRAPGRDPEGQDAVGQRCLDLAGIEALRDLESALEPAEASLDPLPCPLLLAALADVGERALAADGEEVIDKLHLRTPRP
jgi:hypothetical protein